VLPANLRVHETNLPGTAEFLLEVESALVKCDSLREEWIVKEQSLKVSL
jgi:hypothetical protein